MGSVKEDREKNQVKVKKQKENEGKRMEMERGMGRNGDRNGGDRDKDKRRKVSGTVIDKRRRGRNRIKRKESLLNQNGQKKIMRGNFEMKRK